jgi:HK97 family phage prohead protease
MALLVAEMVERVRKRAGRMPGIKTALDYMGGLSTCLDAGFCREWMGSMGDPQRWENAVKAAAGTLVYGDEETVIDGGIAYPTPDEVREFGTKKVIKEKTAGAIMDVEAVYTSSGKDRMGDILEAAGAKVDPSMPALFMHIPFEPIGRHVKVIKQNSKRVEGHFALMDRPLAVDAARMVEFKALRISHGFRPIEYDILDKADDDDDWRVGFHIKSYEMMEVSLVSVPANADAVITLYDREKFMHPLTKSWGKSLFDSRPDLVRSGWTPPAGDRSPGCECHKDANGDKQKRTKISKKNLDKLDEAKELLGKVKDSETVGKADKTLVAAAMANIDDVITDGKNSPDTSADEPQKTAPPATKATPSQLVAGVIAAIDSGADIPAPLAEMLGERLSIVREKNEEAALAAFLN